MKINGAEIKGVIFDMDGVILDSLSIWIKLGRQFVEKHGLEAEEDLYEKIFSMSTEQSIAYFKEHYGLEQSYEELMQELKDYTEDFYYHEVKTKKGAKELMESFSAAGIRMTAATSSLRNNIEHALERNGLLGYIDMIFTNTEVGSSKHDPEIYDLAARSMGTKPGETLVFEDSLYALKTAKAAGYHTVGVYDAIGEPDQKGLKAEADVYVNDPAEFLVKCPVEAEKTSKQ